MESAKKMTGDLKIFTLNCWGIPLISKDKRTRINAIGKFILQNNYDVVCLQEIWSNLDYNFLKLKLKTILPHSHYFHSGVFGSGICVFTRFPLTEVFFYQWQLNGYVHKLQHGDWFGGKGVGFCRFDFRGFSVHLYTAHLHAEYNETSDEYQSHRLLQAYNTAKFVEMTSALADIVILAGDLNTQPTDLSYRVIKSCTHLKDPFALTNRPFAGTNECCDNSYTCANLQEKKFEGKRIDYILLHEGPRTQLEVLEYEHPLPHRIQATAISYSDHEAVAVAVRLVRLDSLTLNKDEEEAIRVLEEAMVVCQNALEDLRLRKWFYRFLAMVLLIVLILTISYDNPVYFPKFYHFLRIIVTGLLLFAIFMSTIWNNIEENAVTAGMLSMEADLNVLKKSVRTMIINDNN